MPSSKEASPYWQNIHATEDRLRAAAMQQTLQPLKTGVDAVFIVTLGRVGPAGRVSECTLRRAACTIEDHPQDAKLADDSTIQNYLDAERVKREAKGMTATSALLQKA